MAPTFVRTVVKLACVMSLALVGCGDDPTGPSQVGAVTIVDFDFQPDNVVVAVGGTVTFTWNGAGVEDHDVQFDAAAITDSPLKTTGTFVATMPLTPGVYPYHCSQHPVAMTGTITVQ